MPSGRRPRSYARLDGMFLHERGEARDDVRIRLRQHTVTEIEDVAATAGSRALDDLERLLLDSTPRSEQRGGIQVALHCVRLRNDGKGQTPVDPDYVTARADHALQQRLRRAGAEVDRRHVDGVEDARGVPLDELLVVRRRERPDP